MKTFRLFCMAALALVMAACSNEDNMMETGSPAESHSIPFTATLAATGSGTTTRTAYTETDDGKITVAWKAGDQIALVHGGQKDVVTVETVNADGSATITGTITAGSDDEPVTAIYPAAMANEDGTVNYAGLTSQSGTLESIAANIDARQGSGTLSVSGGVATLSSNLTMASQIAIWKLTLQDNAATPNALSATKVTIKNGEEVIASTTTGISAISTVSLAVPAVSGANLTIKATVGSDTYVFSKPFVSLTAGKYYQSTVTMTKDVYLDLSMLDCAGNARESRSSANCYMVHKAGDYKLPLVYGNAIKNGETNATAYTGVENANTTTTFPRHDGNAITAPWIKDNGITVTSAQLLWQDAEGLITAVGIEGNYLTLSVGKDATEQEGNAVVAAKTSDGTIVWSWHIWVTKQTFASKKLATINGYKVTPVNLGWVGDAVSQGYCTFYQWGRKDAFIPSTGTANTNHTVYDINNSVVTGLTYEASTTATIADNIKNPTTHFYNSSTKGPCTTTYYNMWDAQQTNDGENITTATKKTVYDPCPAGFCVPTGGLYYYITNTIGTSGSTWNGTNKGRNVTTPSVFFPASGCRGGSDGSDCNLRIVGSGGYVFSASAYGVSGGRYLGFGSTGWGWYGSNRAYGFPIRAVAEE